MKALLVTLLISTTHTATFGQHSLLRDSGDVVWQYTLENSLLQAAAKGILSDASFSPAMEKRPTGYHPSGLVNVKAAGAAWSNNMVELLLPFVIKSPRYGDFLGSWQTFTIGETYGFGNENYVYGAIKTGAAPSWFETWWFRFGLLLFVLMAISLIITYRLNYLLGKDEQRKLRRQAYFQGKMIAAINHDIQTPLAYLVLSLGRVEDFLDRSSADPFIRETGRTAYLSARQISRFTSNLLLFIKSQMIGDKDSIPVDAIQLDELVAFELDFFSATIRSKELFFENGIEKGITVSSNRNMLSVIIHNLIDNAIKNTYKGGVSVFAVQNAGAVDFYVKDTGTGVKSEVIEWLELGSRQPDLSEKFELSDDIGIGLIIVKDLSDMLKIKFYVESTSDAGATVRLSFPVQG